MRAWLLTGALVLSSAAPAQGFIYTPVKVTPINVTPVDPHRPPSPEETLNAKQEEDRVAQPLPEGEGVKLPDKQFEIPAEPEPPKMAQKPRPTHAKARTARH